MNLPGSKGEHQLQEKFGSARRALGFYNKQVMDHLSPVMQRFIGEQELLFIATADSHGECDCSFRAGEPGFVQVISKKSLIFPEYRGNGVMASLGNISENPNIGMIFVDIYKTTVGLHVNGKAKILEEFELYEHLPNDDQVTALTRDKSQKKSERWIMVSVEEAYIHCSKHIPLVKKLDKDIHWGTDDAARKGGDFFEVKKITKPWEVAKETALID